MKMTMSSRISASKPAAAVARKVSSIKPVRPVVTKASETGTGARAQKVLKGPYIVKITSSNIEYEQGINVSPGTDSELLEYLSTSIASFPDIALPLGGSLARIDASNFKLTTPKLELFDIWLQPTAEALVR
eukprot:gene31170-6312_t